ncbi:MAG: hypothetical protein A2V88_02745 [Elusimicrobia bacterium RBG_16_66_12]|nr:MAG: hypothetical protein A2V88_02745 [Elusimicrobia bacterium RBG_16_66_12]
MPRPERRDRGDEFMFNPDHYLNDPAVLAMNLEERGAYSTLLFGIWKMPEPGVVQNDDVILAALARATADEWGRVKPRVLAAFDSEGRPGWIVQRRMVETHKRQTRNVERMREQGRMGAVTRWAATEKMAKLWPSHSERGTGYGVRGKDKTPHPTPAASKDRGNAVCVIPCKGAEAGVPIYQSEVARIAAKLPTVDVMGELKKIVLWCAANPKRKKTARGVMRFVTAWMMRAQHDSTKRPKARRRSDADYIASNLVGHGE